MTPFKLTRELTLIDLAVAMSDRQTLGLADVHLGFEEALHRDGALVPRGHLTIIQERLRGIADALGISAERPWDRLVINGDLRHQFGPFTAQEWTHIRQFLGHFLDLFETIVLVQGNHDGDLDVLAREFPRVEVQPRAQLGRTLFWHGDADPGEIPADVDTLVIGHDHPAIRLRDPVTGRMELFKCFLTGAYAERTLVVLPSFNPWTAGSDLTQERPLSPVLNEVDLASMTVYLVSDQHEIFPFGALGRLMPQNAGPSSTLDARTDG